MLIMGNYVTKRRSTVNSLETLNAYIKEYISNAGAEIRVVETRKINCERKLQRLTRMSDISDTLNEIKLNENIITLLHHTRIQLCSIQAHLNNQRTPLTQKCNEIKRISTSVLRSNQLVNYKFVTDLVNDIENIIDNLLKDRH